MNGAIAFWTTGGVTTGLGHVRRCLSLAEALRARDTTATFVLDGDEAVANFVKDHGFEVRKSLAEVHAPAVVVDSYAATAADLTSLRERFAVAVIDDLADRELPADIIINSSPAKTRSDYRALPDTEFFLGPQYALLRSEFSEPVPSGRVRESLSTVLITVGGSDPHGITPLVVQKCATALPDAQMDVIVGPMFAGDSEQQIAAVCPAAKCHRNAPDVRDLMLAADLAISGGGQTIFELAATGTPALAISTAANQNVNLTAFEDRGILQWIGDAADPQFGDRLARAVTGLADVSRRRAVSERGRATVDGRGATRVAAALVECVG